MMQPQAAPQSAQVPGPQVAPQQQPAPQGQQQQTPQPQGMAPQAQGQTPQQGQAKGNAGYDAKVAAMVESHLNGLPDDQKAYLVQYMTPELAILFGILLGHDAYQYFNQFVDPKKQLTVVPREQQGQPQGQGPAQQQSPQPTQQAQPVQQPAQSAPQQAQPTQGKAPSIMGV